jgi:hypothetical protein
MHDFGSVTMRRNGLKCSVLISGGLDTTLTPPIGPFLFITFDCAPAYMRLQLHGKR